MLRVASVAQQSGALFSVLPALRGSVDVPRQSSHGPFAHIG
jgi:hypothetical protein